MKSHFPFSKSKLELFRKREWSLGPSFRKSNHEISLENYLSELDRALCGSIPEAHRIDYVQETGFWVEHNAGDALLQGIPYPEAISEALAKHGNPQQVANQYIAKYYEDALDSPVYRFLGRANTTAVAILGTANALYLGFLQLRILLSNAPALHPRWSPAEARVWFPEPLPFPDMTWIFLITVGYPLLAPIFGGFLCGRAIPVGAFRAIYKVLMPMVAGAFLLGSVLLPEKSALLYAILLLLWWMPAGMLSAEISSFFARRKRRRKAVEAEAPAPTCCHTSGDKPSCEAIHIIHDRLVEERLPS